VLSFIRSTAGDRRHGSGWELHSHPRQNKRGVGLGGNAIKHTGPSLIRIQKPSLDPHLNERMNMLYWRSGAL
jgi:hypothetical protein